MIDHRAARTVKKEVLHPRNRHQGRYDFSALLESDGELAMYIRRNPHGERTIDFSDPASVRSLNRALLAHFYQVKGWDIPDGFLCPPIPGRADYLHYLADLLAEDFHGVVPEGRHLKVLDIGVGANCVYPLIGQFEYGWQFVGSELNPVALASAQKILANNPALMGEIECRLQPSSVDIFKGVVAEGEYFDLTLCNPPFHASAEEAQAGNWRKQRNLGQGRRELNFGGQQQELWCKGGEVSFIRRMITESGELAERCLWFSSLVSKSESLVALKRALKRVAPVETRIIEMRQGQKSSRILAWSFHTAEQRQQWALSRWMKG